MTLSPIDVAQQQFSRGWPGANSREVEAFLHTVAQDMAALVQRNAEVQAQLSAQKQKVQLLEARENDVREALVLAQRAVEELRTRADREAQLRIEQAEVQGQKIIAEAQERHISLSAQVKDLLRQRTRFVEELRGLLATHARLLDLHVADAQPAQRITGQVLANSGNDVFEMLQAPLPPAMVDAPSNRRPARAARPAKSVPHAPNE